MIICYAYVLSCFSHVQLFGTLWTVACQAPLSMDFPGKNTGVVAMSFSRGSSQPRDWTHISWHFLHWQAVINHCTPWEARICHSANKTKDSLSIPFLSKKWFPNKMSLKPHPCCHSGKRKTNPPTGSEDTLRWEPHHSYKAWAKSSRTCQREAQFNKNQLDRQTVLWTSL